MKIIDLFETNTKWFEITFMQDGEKKTIQLVGFTINSVTKVFKRQYKIEPDSVTEIDDR